LVAHGQIELQKRRLGIGLVIRMSAPEPSGHFERCRFGLHFRFHEKKGLTSPEDRARKEIYACAVLAPSHNLPVAADR
jgi:hypothetical protein